MKGSDMQSFIEAGSKKPAKKDRPSSCDQCQGISFKPRLATYPVTLTQPKKIAGKRIDVFALLSTNARPAVTSCPLPRDEPKSTAASNAASTSFSESLP